jgi:putative tryptophan/tyrosine transport system substrate-binding protein
MARPGGIITGFTSFEYPIGGKWLELLKEAVSSLKRLPVLLNQENYTLRALLRTIETVAPSAGVRVGSAAVRTSSRLNRRSTRSHRIQRQDDRFARPSAAKRITSLTITHRLPAIHQSHSFAVTGAGP